MKKILVPIDGSEYSSMALDMAKKMAQAFASSITILHVMDDEGSNYASNPYTFSPELVVRIQKENSVLAAKILEDAKNSLSDLKENVETKLLSGPVAATILDYVEKNDFDFIIMGSSGMGGLRGAIGSVARRVTLSVNLPTLIVR